MPVSGLGQEHPAVLQDAGDRFRQATLPRPFLVPGRLARGRRQDRRTPAFVPRLGSPEAAPRPPALRPGHSGQGAPVVRQAIGVERVPRAEPRTSLRTSASACSSSTPAQRPGDESADLLHLRSAHAAGGHGRRAEADAAGDHRRAGVERDRVLVDGDAGPVERGLGLLAGDALARRRRPASGGCRCRRETRRQPAPRRASRARAWALSTICALVGLELRLAAPRRRHTALAAITCMSGPPWMPGKTLLSMSLANSRLAQDHAAARAAQRLVRRGGDEVRVRHRARVQARGHQAGDVGHVDHQIGAAPASAISRDAARSR